MNDKHAVQATLSVGAWRLVALGFVTVVGCNGQPASSECDANGACPRGFVCMEHVCRLTCVNSADCGERAACVEGLCQDGKCESAADCKRPGICTLGASATCTAGRCFYPPAPEGTVCDDDDLCTDDDRCVEQQCRGIARSCDEPPASSCTHGICDSATGLCDYTTLPDGQTCDLVGLSDGQCQGGSCIALSYAWVSSAWSACSVTCGSGSQTRVVTCQRSVDSASVTDNYCTAPKPATTQACTGTTACDSTLLPAPAPGDTECANGQLKTCVVDSNGCPFWSSLIPCPSGLCRSSTECLPVGDPGVGLWSPDLSANPVVYVADQSLNQGAPAGISRLPGCINGGSIDNSSPCTSWTSYSGTIDGQPVSVRLDPTQILSIRFISSGIAQEALSGTLRLTNSVGGNVGHEIKMWLSVEPGAKFPEGSKCGVVSSRTPGIGLGSSYCSVTGPAKTLYYLNIQPSTAAFEKLRLEESGVTVFEP